jgi:hypothetical protein
MMQVLKDQKEIDDPNFVKVAVDKNMNSLFLAAVLSHIHAIQQYL